MKALNPSTGNLEEIYVKALDSLPVGSQIDFSGTDIPAGWEQVNDYSTSEVYTGKKWIDGKKIYRKAYDISGTYSTGNITIDSSLTTSYVDSLVSVQGSFVASSGTLFPMAFINYAATQYVGVFVGANGLVAANQGTTIAKIKLIIEYTKAS